MTVQLVPKRKEEGVGICFQSKKGREVALNSALNPVKSTQLYTLVDISHDHALRAGRNLLA